MLINLHDIIDIPDAAVDFDYSPDLSDAAGGSVTSVSGPSRAVGQIRNAAGVLEFTADVETTLSCVCARCLKEFDKPMHQHISVTLSADSEDEFDSADVYPLDGDSIETDDIVVGEFILNMDQRQLCRDDCKGLCEKCGADLNNGPCTCEKEIDPRLAVLGQLLGE